MFQGTGSGVGKSVLAAGFCRLLKRRGYRVRPFKAQNMALNSGVTGDGLEIGRAQMVQAFACGVDPDARMNPVLLKPQGPGVSQLIRMGRVAGVFSAREYYRQAEVNFGVALRALNSLREECDWVVIEGAGSPAEINLQSTDIVNMRLAESAQARVMLIGDIDRGGVFAWLKGTYDLVQEKHRPLIKGLLINKFRGDVSLLQPGIEQFAQHVPVPVLGVIPWRELDLEDEDSQNLRSRIAPGERLSVAVVRLPYISNFTDYDPLKQVPDVSVRFIRDPVELKNADLVILPGSKNTILDLRFLRERGFADELLRLQDRTWVLGICGGFQMLGTCVEDPGGMESGGSEPALGMLRMTTVLGGDKRLARREYCGRGWLQGVSWSAYEIHLGSSRWDADPPGPFVLENETLGVIDHEKRVLGTYLHGMLESPEVMRRLLALVSREEFAVPDSFREIRERELDELARFLGEHCDVDRVLGI